MKKEENVTMSAEFISKIKSFDDLYTGGEIFQGVKGMHQEKGFVYSDSEIYQDMINNGMTIFDKKLQMLAVISFTDMKIGQFDWMRKYFGEGCEELYNSVYYDTLLNEPLRDNDGKIIKRINSFVNPLIFLTDIITDGCCIGRLHKKMEGNYYYFDLPFDYNMVRISIGIHRLIF
ncbi:MAG TPA: hypothetical protein VJZ04_01395 [Lachnospiraceae bacterium]|nr:hypothetical protein [Lachnospiraceae bacterium]